MIKRFIRMRLLPALSTLAVTSTFSCSYSSERDVFVVEVLGSVSSLTEYEIVADGLNVSPSPVFSRGSLLRRAISTETPDGEFGRAHDIRIMKGDQTIDSIVLKPFLCKKIPIFEDGNHGPRMSAKELHQIYVNDNGKIEVDADFERRLMYYCEVVDNKKGDGTKLFVAWHKDPWCSDSSRSKTDVSLSGSINGKPFVETAEQCIAVLTDIRRGTIQIEFQAVLAGVPFSFLVHHELESEKMPTPLTLQVKGINETTATSAQVSVPGHEGGTQWNSATGVLRVESADFQRFGRISGEINVKIKTNSGDELSVKGPYDLPFNRIPIEGDWQP